MPDVALDPVGFGGFTGRFVVALANRELRGYL